jgi:hypothetical protein
MAKKIILTICCVFPNISRLSYFRFFNVKMGAELNYIFRVRKQYFLQYRAKCMYLMALS